MTKKDTAVSARIRGGQRTASADSKASDRPRIRRSPPSRSAPLRSARHLFRSAPGPAPSVEPASGAAAAPAAEGVRPQAQDAINAAVETAYRVCDQYLQMGRSAASRFAAAEPMTSGDNMRNDPWSLPWPSPWSPGPQGNPVAMAMQFWQDMARMWMGYAMPFMPGMMPGRQSPFDLGAPMRAGGAPPGAPPMPSSPPGPAPLPQLDPSSAQGVAAEELLSVDVVTAGAAQVQVRIDLQPGALRSLQPTRGHGEPSELAAIAHAIDGSTPALPPCHFQVHGGHPRIKITVPAEQPAGTYVGAIVDRRSSRALGTVTIVLSRAA